jgi:hypothetical protein
MTGSDSNEKVFEPEISKIRAVVRSRDAVAVLRGNQGGQHGEIVFDRNHSAEGSKTHGGALGFD